MKKTIVFITFCSIALLIVLAIINTDFSKENPEFTDAEGRTKYMLDRRNGQLNSNALKAAEKIISSEIEKLKADSRDGDIDGWEELGPYNMGGRIRAIAINPNDGDDIFIGAAAGGIWRSIDGGINWFLVTPYNDSYPVMDIQFHPSNGSTILAATGEYHGGGPEYPGVGVLRSLDGGSTWTKMNQPSTDNFKFLSKVRYNPSTPSIVFASGSKRESDGTNDVGVIYKSTNGGLDWSELYIESDISGNISDLEIHPTSPDIMVFGNRKSIYYSSDSGDTWDESSFNSSNSAYVGRHEVEFCKSDPDVLYGFRYRINNTISPTSYQSILYKSSNDGANFSIETFTASNSSSLNILGKQGDYDNVLWVNPIDCDKVIMGGLDVWKYKDGDASPTKISDWEDDINGNAATGTNNSIHADQHVIVEHPDFNNTTNQEVFFGNDGGIYKTNNIGTVSQNSQWLSLVADLNITQFYGADVSYDGNTLVGGAQDNGYMFDINSNNGLGTFAVYSTGDGGYCRVDKSNSNIFYTSTQNGNVYKTTNGGNTFCHIFSFTRNTQFGCCDCGNFDSDIQGAQFITPLIMNPNDSQHLILAGQTLYETKDGGDTWNDITNFVQGANSPEISAVDIASSNSNYIYLGADSGTLAYTTNGGGTFSDWTIISSGALGLPAKLITDIAVHPLDELKVMITFGGFDQNHIYLTEDGGASWTNLSLDFDMQVNTVTWHPSLTDFVYVGTDIGIFASENNGDDWSVVPHLSNSEGPVFTSVEELFWQGGGSTQNIYYLMAATHGRGIWRTITSVGSKIYVDKNCFFCGENVSGAPYQFFENALAAAVPGMEIIFQSSGDHNEAPPSIIVTKSVLITKEGSGNAIIK